jgi:hypothetical protein
MAFMLNTNGADPRWMSTAILRCFAIALCCVCPVLVDGAATQSCITPVDSVGKSAVTRIEVVSNTSVTPRPKGRARHGESNDFNIHRSKDCRVCGWL